MKPSLLPVIAITPGDPEGIGPEIVEKVLRVPAFYKKRFMPLIIGDARPFKKSKLPIRYFHSPEEIDWNQPGISFLSPKKAPAKNPVPGWYSGWAIEVAAKLCLQKVASALVTGPIDKDRLQKGGYAYFGHTDMLADLCDTSHVTMMLANNVLRVSLVTIHQSLQSVSKSVTKKAVQQTLLQTKVSLQADFGIRKPRIAVLGLNPHCGERGLMGEEENKTLSPAIAAFQKKHSDTDVSGPYPADTFFAVHYGKKPTKAFDAVLAMYHDQGLIPVKMIDFDRSVNLTLGLPIVRTSVDHGTAFDIVGKGTANPSSLESAIELALEMVKNRRSS